MEIKALAREAYAGRSFTARYTTSGYYTICADGHGFRMDYVSLEAPMEKSFDDVFSGSGWTIPSLTVHLSKGGCWDLRKALWKRGTTASASAISAYLTRRRDAGVSGPH